MELVPDAQTLVGVGCDDGGRPDLAPEDGRRGLGTARGRVLGADDPGRIEPQVRGGHGVAEAVLAPLGGVDARRPARPADASMAAADEVLGGEPRRLLVIEDDPALRADGAAVHQQRRDPRIREELVGVVAGSQARDERGVHGAAAQQPQVALA